MQCSRCSTGWMREENETVNVKSNKFNRCVNCGHREYIDEEGNKMTPDREARLFPDGKPDYRDPCSVIGCYANARLNDGPDAMCNECRSSSLIYLKLERSGRRHDPNVQGGHSGRRVVRNDEDEWILNPKKRDLHTYAPNRISKWDGR